MNPVLSRLILIIALPIALVAGATYAYKVRYIPRSGTSELKGRDAAIRLTMDEHGVSHIEAGSDRDVYFAMGYLHARDRAWELEMARRLAQGRLSELLGEQSIQQDIWMRTLGLYRSAESAERALDAPARASLEAYAAGVNQGFRQHIGASVEMVAFGVDPAPWRPADSLAVLKLVALAMAGSLNTEIGNSIAVRSLNQAQRKSLGLEEPESMGLSTALPLNAHADLVARLAAAPLMSHAAAVGSNAWVVSGKHTQDGKPILANDPHMSLAIPSAWYAVRQSGPGLSADGMSLVGLPLVVFGKNRFIAWGGTNLMADATDLFIELPVPGQPDEYLDGKQRKRFAVRTEEILVAPKWPAFLHERPPPYRLRVRETVRGPVISDVMAKLDQPVSLRWTALDPGDTSYQAFYRLNYARNWPEFRAAMARHVAPALNLLYADVEGNIGFAVAGRIPIRAAGTGSLPRPAWTGEQWRGYVASERLPAMLNPERGYIVSANNQIAGLSYPDFITNNWAEPYRARRVEQMIAAAIAAGGRVSVDATAAMQHDLVTLDAAILVPALLATRPSTGQQRAALDLLRRWDHRMSADSAAATIYEAWQQRLRERLVAPRLEHFYDPRRTTAVANTVTSSITAADLVNELTSSTPVWCEQQGCAAELEESLKVALRDLSKLAGTEPRNWRWGDVHSVRLTHTPFSQLPLLRSLFERRYPSPGGRNTVNAADARLNASEGFEQTFGAVFRQVMQPGNGRHLYANSTGQSGNPLSHHYDDLIDYARAGTSLDLAPEYATAASRHRAGVTP